ncbi:MAG: ABC transporter permease [Candidatus Cloacimonetes bacterium]|nr:ABC transporter permease [Candidatus Cloacimonadota bacterium]
MITSSGFLAGFFLIIGEYIVFNLNIFLYLRNIFKRFDEILRQMKRIGYDSLLLISVTAGFTGMVTSVQASYQTSGYIPKSLIGVLVGKSTMIELAPVLTALVLSGKVGASIAAEIGTMRVSEQIEALETMAVDPYDYIYLPRVLAGALMVPLLTVYGNVIGIFAAFFLSVFKYGVNAYSFFHNMREYFLPSDLWGGLVKALFFGLIITTVGCFAGSKTRGGAEGVGRVATLTVVYSSILILIMDFIVAALLFGGM